MISPPRSVTFSDRPDSSMIIFQTLSFIISSNDRHTSFALTTYIDPLVPLVEGFPPTWSLFSPPWNFLWISCATQKHVCATWCYLNTLTEEFQVLVMEFSPTGLNIFRFICGSFLCAHSWTTRKRRGISKNTLKITIVAEKLRL